MADSTQSDELKKLLLVACSDPLIMKAVADVLSTWKMECARDNKEAFELVEKEAFELVITDDKSAGREDVELLRKIRLVRPHTRLIIITDESTPADVVAAIRGRAFSYFTRPFSQSALEEMLQLATECPTWDEGIEMVSGTDSWLRLSVRCDIGAANRVLQFIHEALDLPEPEADKVGTAFREMLLNAMEHGGKFDPTRRVEFGYLRAQHMVACRIKDPGEGFSLLENEDTAANNPPDDPLRHLRHREKSGVRPGGYGVLLAKNMVDEMFYTEKGNEVLLIKYINGDKGAEA
jgi:anti-sigma regulatory factor (Ser/Thr protein kinase)/ActR/RegA family two-component response regulator